MDRLLTGENPEWFYPLLAGLTLVSVMQILGYDRTVARIRATIAQLS